MLDILKKALATTKTEIIEQILTPQVKKTITEKSELYLSGQKDQRNFYLFNRHINILKDEISPKNLVSPYEKLLFKRFLISQGESMLGFNLYDDIKNHLVFSEKKHDKILSMLHSIISAGSACLVDCDIRDKNFSNFADLFKSKNDPRYQMFTTRDLEIQDNCSNAILALALNGVLFIDSSTDRSQEAYNNFFNDYLFPFFINHRLVRITAMFDIHTQLNYDLIRKLQDRREDLYMDMVLISKQDFSDEDRESIVDIEKFNALSTSF